MCLSRVLHNHVSPEKTTPYWMNHDTKNWATPILLLSATSWRHAQEVLQLRNVCIWAVVRASLERAAKAPVGILKVKKLTSLCGDHLAW